MIPLSIPNFEGNELKYVTDAVSQGWVSTGGSYITQLEHQMSSFLHIDDAVACQSGTSAIHLALMESGVGVQDLVIVPTLTFIAAVNPVKYCGADPIFMDCDDSLCMDPVKLEAFCREECDFNGENLIHKTTQRKVKAIVVVHVFGNMADMESIIEIADKYNLYVIEDATEALGTKYTEGKYSGKYAGTIGDFGAYSYNGNKIITTGGGGMVVAKERKSLDHIRYISTQAKDDALFYVHNEIGYNYRMTNVQAAIGVAQMELLEEFIKRKNDNYIFYQKSFAGDERITLLETRDGVFSNKWFYALKVNKKIDVKMLVKKLAEKGVQTRTIWGLINEQKPYADAIAYKIEKAKMYADSIINIPCSTNITKSEIDTVCDIIKETV